MTQMLNILNNQEYMLDLCVRMAHHSTAIIPQTIKAKISKILSKK